MPDDPIVVLTNLVETADAVETNIKARNEDTKKEQARLQSILEKEIPEVMNGIGLTSFTTEGGLEVNLVEKVRASMPENKKPVGFAWLRENGYGSIIDNSLTVEDVEHVDAKSISTILEQMGCDYKIKEGVHHSRLNSFVSGLMEDGIELPEDGFTIFIQPIVKIKQKKN